MRTHSAVVVFLALVSNILLSPEITAQLSEEELAEATFSVAGLSDGDTAVLNKLRENVSCEYFESRMGDILDELRRSLEVNVLLHDSAPDNNLDEETIVSYSRENVSWHTLLMAMLEPYHTTISIRDGAIVILTYDAVYNQPDLRIYDCSGMLNRIGDRNVEENAGKLIDSLNRNIDPDGWASQGGVFTVSHFDGLMMIRQSSSNHQKIEQLLRKIDRKSAK